MEFIAFSIPLSDFFTTKVTKNTKEGLSGIGHSVEDCLFKAKWGMKEHVELLMQEGLPVPLEKTDPKIIVQNEKKMEFA